MPNNKSVQQLKELYIADRKFLAENGEALQEESIEDFVMWSEANSTDSMELKAEEVEEVEFSAEEQEVLSGVAMAEISKSDGRIIVKLMADEDNFVELEINDDETLEEEHEEALSEVMEEGAE